ncbi:MAG: AAA family ATPase, partial [Bacteroidetes bacterium]|nr:AAA family ATPase [Bacteroidota bacterium]
MIKEIRIENYKSIQKLKLNLGRITVLIGENGGGKSNILEAIALSSAASQDKLDNEFLVSRGIRVTEPQFMRAAFDKENVAKAIRISLAADKLEPDLTCELQNDNHPYSKWKNIEFPDFEKGAREHLAKAVYADYISEFIGLDKFLIYSPENLSLRTFEKEGQIQPLGIHGEGLFKLLRVMSSGGNKE